MKGKDIEEREKDGAGGRKEERRRREGAARPVESLLDALSDGRVSRALIPPS